MLKRVSMTYVYLAKRQSDQGEARSREKGWKGCRKHKENALRIETVSGEFRPEFPTQLRCQANQIQGWWSLLLLQFYQLLLHVFCLSVVRSIHVKDCYDFLKNWPLHYAKPSLSLITYIALKSTLSEINITTFLIRISIVYLFPTIYFEFMSL